MRLTLLGTGCPEPSLRRASSGYMIEVSGERLLFDVGGGVFDRLLQAGVMPTEIDRLFLSHLHSDHMMDYARLVHAQWDAGKGLLGTPPMAVYGPAPLATLHERLFGPEGALAFDIEARRSFPGSQEVWLDRGGSLPRPEPQVSLTEIEAGFSLDAGAWRLTTCAVPHADPFLTGLAFRLDADGKSIVYSGDAGLCALLEALANDADVLVHWCYRLSHETRYQSIAQLSPHPGEIGAMAARAGVRHLILTHLRGHMDASPEIHAGMLAEAEAAFGGSVEIAEDLASLTL